MISRVLIFSTFLTLLAGYSVAGNATWRAKCQTHGYLKSETTSYQACLNQTSRHNRAVHNGFHKATCEHVLPPYIESRK